MKNYIATALLVTTLTGGDIINHASQSTELENMVAEKTRLPEAPALTQTDISAYIAGVKQFGTKKEVNDCNNPRTIYSLNYPLEFLHNDQAYPFMLAAYVETETEQRASLVFMGFNNADGEVFQHAIYDIAVERSPIDGNPELVWYFPGEASILARHELYDTDPCQAYELKKKELGNATVADTELFVAGIKFVIKKFQSGMEPAG